MNKDIPFYHERMEYTHRKAAGLAREANLAIKNGELKLFRLWEPLFCYNNPFEGILQDLLINRYNLAATVYRNNEIVVEIDLRPGAVDKLKQRIKSNKIKEERKFLIQYSTAIPLLILLILFIVAMFKSNSR